MNASFFVLISIVSLNAQWSSYYGVPTLYEYVLEAPLPHYITQICVRHSAPTLIEAIKVSFSNGNESEWFPPSSTTAIECYAASCFTDATIRVDAAYPDYPQGFQVHTRDNQSSPWFGGSGQTIFTLNAPNDQCISKIYVSFYVSIIQCIRFYHQQIIINDPSYYQRTATAGNIIGTIDVLDEVYVSFDITLNSLLGNDTFNVFQIGNDITFWQFPSVDLSGKDVLQWVFALPYEIIPNITHLNAFKEGQTHAFSFRQSQSDQTVTWDNATFSRSIGSHTIMMNSNIYVVNPWDAVPNITIQNLFVETATNQWNYACDSRRWYGLSGFWMFNDTDCTISQQSFDDGAVAGIEDYDLVSFDWVNYTITAQFVINSWSDSASAVGLLFRAQGLSPINEDGQQYFVGVMPKNGNDMTLVSWTFDGIYTSQWTGPISIPESLSHTLKIECSGNEFTVWDNGVHYLTYFLPFFEKGSVGLRTHTATATFTSITIEFETDNTLHSVSPTQTPTEMPTLSQTDPPTTATHDPTTFPTKDPTVEPTVEPTLEPSKPPTQYPTQYPTLYPTQYPTQYPSKSPTEPTPFPTKYPTQPTQNPTKYPTQQPLTKAPTQPPTKYPSKYPTEVTEDPTTNPTTNPTTVPTDFPSMHSTENDNYVDADEQYKAELVNLTELFQIFIGMIMGSFVLLSLVAFIDAKFIRKNDYFSAVAILKAAIQMVDMLSDCFFVIEVRIQQLIHSNTAYDIILPLSIVFVAVPALMTLLQLYNYAKKYWLKNDYTRSWLTRFVTLLLMLSVVTGSSFAAVTILNTYIFHLTVFDMGLTDKQMAQFNTGRVYSIVLFENLPQLIIQSCYIFILKSGNNNENVIAAFSISFSLISIIVSALGIALQKTIFYTESYVVLSMNITGDCVEKKAKKCRTMRNGVRRRIARILGVDENTIQVIKPAYIEGGFTLSMYVNSSVKKDFKAILIEAEKSGKLGNVFKDNWDLDDIPTVSGIDIELVLSRQETEIKGAMDGGTQLAKRMGNRTEGAVEKTDEEKGDQNKEDQHVARPTQSTDDN